MVDWFYGVNPLSCLILIEYAIWNRYNSIWVFSSQLNIGMQKGAFSTTTTTTMATDDDKNPLFRFGYCVRWREKKNWEESLDGDKSEATGQQQWTILEYYFHLISFPICICPCAFFFLSLLLLCVVLCCCSVPFLWCQYEFAIVRRLPLTVFFAFNEDLTLKLLFCKLFDCFSFFLCVLPDSWTKRKAFQSNYMHCIRMHCTYCLKWFTAVCECRNVVRIRNDLSMKLEAIRISLSLYIYRVLSKHECVKWRIFQVKTKRRCTERNWQDPFIIRNIGLGNWQSVSYILFSLILVSGFFSLDALCLLFFLSCISFTPFECAIYLTICRLSH